ncbi:hypothetical protein [Shewanella algae]|uniref:hypothetical protein n=1 Tax=Shewanella algae TaxID=38313 RepID=UPI0031F56C47
MFEHQQLNYLNNKVSIMLTAEMKEKIEFEANLGGERITGIRLYRILGCHLDDDEAIWVAALGYFEQCRHNLKEKAARATALEQQRKFDQAQRAVKREDQRLKKSRNLHLAAIIGRIKYVLKGDLLTVTFPQGAIVGLEPAKAVRAYLRRKGITRIGRTLANGVAFSGEAMAEILAWLGSRLQPASLAAREIAMIPLGIVMRCYRIVEVSGFVPCPGGGDWRERISLGVVKANGPLRSFNMTLL